MIREIRYYRLPLALIEEQKGNILTKDLYITEAGEIEMQQGIFWNMGNKLENNLLAYCTKGEGIVILGGEKIPVTGEQFFIVPKNDIFKFFSTVSNTRFLVAGFNGIKARQLGREFSVVRNLVPPMNNMVANREMLFDEIFNNLARGFHDENLEYINFCLGHLLATFIYAHQTSDDIADRSNPAVRRIINFLEKNLNKKLTLEQIAYEAGYSTTYFTTLFKKETNYSPISYFSHLKILKSCEFLDYTKMKIKEISFHFGYSDPYYFTKDFKKKMGMSPRQYRQRARY